MFIHSRAAVTLSCHRHAITSLSADDMNCGQMNSIYYLLRKWTHMKKKRRPILDWYRFNWIMFNLGSSSCAPMRIRVWWEPPESNRQNKKRYNRAGHVLHLIEHSIPIFCSIRVRTARRNITIKIKRTYRLRCTRSACSNRRLHCLSSSTRSTCSIGNRVPFTCHAFLSRALIKIFHCDSGYGTVIRSYRLWCDNVKHVY